jgi:hypothetical protein
MSLTQNTLGKEFVPADEGKSIETILGVMRTSYDTQYPEGTRADRDAHPICTGFVRAKFVVAEFLPEHLRTGIFSVAGQEFDAVIRFSNGFPKPALKRRNPDIFPDVRGFAIKLFGVPGTKLLPGVDANAPTQDFLLANAPSFFVKDAKDYIDMVIGVQRLVFPSWNPLRWRLREASLLAQAILKIIPSNTEIDYHSQLPYALGDNAAVKYKVRPIFVGPYTPVSKLVPEYLLENLRLQLKDPYGVILEFMVQEQNSLTMPIEDPRKVWSPAESSFLTAAFIYILPQTPDDGAKARDLSFSPWHSLPEHRPLGGIGRVRRAVYDMISGIRHRRTGVERKEPNDLSFLD